jgi:hypothetical protein
MKAKKIEKKLVLNKETVTNLDRLEMGALQGGVKDYITYMTFCDTDFSCFETNCLDCRQSFNFTECYSQCIC